MTKFSQILEEEIGIGEVRNEIKKLKVKKVASKSRWDTYRGMEICR